MTKERERRSVLTKFRTPNAKAMTKVKARRLILEADSSTESSVDASQGCHTLEEEAELEVETVVRDKDGPLEKDLQTSEKRYSAGMKRRATRKEKGKNIMTDEGTQERNQVPLAEAKVSAHMEKLAKC